MIVLPLIILSCIAVAAYYYRRGNARAVSVASIATLLCLVVLVGSIARHLSASNAPNTGVGASVAAQPTATPESIASLSTDTPASLGPVGIHVTVPQEDSPLLAFNDEEAFSTYVLTTEVRGADAAQSFAQGQRSFDVASAGSVTIIKRDELGDVGNTVACEVQDDAGDEGWTYCAVLDSIQTPQAYRNVGLVAPDVSDAGILYLFPNKQDVCIYEVRQNQQMQSATPPSGYTIAHSDGSPELHARLLQSAVGLTCSDGSAVDANKVQITSGPDKGGVGWTANYTDAEQ